MINAFSHICCHLNNARCQEEIHPWLVCTNQALLILSPQGCKKQQLGKLPPFSSPSPAYISGWVGESLWKDDFFLYPAKAKKCLPLFTRRESGSILQEPSNLLEEHVTFSGWSSICMCVSCPWWICWLVLQCFYWYNEKTKEGVIKKHS